MPAGEDWVSRTITVQPHHATYSSVRLVSESSKPVRTVVSWLLFRSLSRGYVVMGSITERQVVHAQHLTCSPTRDVQLCKACQRVEQARGKRGQLVVVQTPVVYTRGGTS